MPHIMANRESHTVIEPLVSCLCVTEGRAAFMPWLLWCFERQTWANRELIIVDSSPGSFPLTVPEAVRVITAPKGTNVATKRNIALASASGEYITWFDDDDWQHPDKLGRLVAALAGGAPMAGSAEGWFFNLHGERCRRFQARRGHILFNGAGFRRDIAVAHRFPEHRQKASDSYWMLALKARHTPVKISGAPLFFWLSHERNLSNPANRGQFSAPLSELKARVGDAAWGDTDDALKALRGALATRRSPLPTTRPARPVRLTASAGAPNATPSTPHDRSTVTPRVTACLLSWKRPGNIQQIVNHLHARDEVDEILIWNNDRDQQLNLHGDKVRVIQSDDNKRCYGRFLCARQAKNDIIFVQDDDVIVHNFQTLYRSFLRDGTRITHTLSPGHYRNRERYRYADSEVALLGWGAFFRRSWLQVLDTCVEEDGADALFLREADKFFSLLLGTTPDTHCVRIRELPGSNSEGVALWRERDHREFIARAISRALRLKRQARSVPFPVTWNIVVPCRNYGRFLSDAVKSVLRNDADYVVTIVDDASTDDSLEIARRLADSHEQVSLIRNEQNFGVSNAVNRGIAAVDSTFVIRLDADDRIGPDYLHAAERQLASGVDVANPDAIVFGTHRARWTVPHDTTLAMLRQRNRVHCCAAFRRSYWAQVGGLDESMHNWQDYEFWIRIAKAGARIRRLSGDHFYYRKHGESKSSHSARIREGIWVYLRQKHPDLFVAAKSA
jgi:glycosyltransferase involved in cell wall biosynthesis